MAALTGTPDAARRAVLVRRVRLLVAATIAWNVVEAVVALVAGRVASSAALVAFGLDSVVEVLSAAAVAWQFAGPDPQSRERTAMRLIAASFLGLAVFVSVDALNTLWGTLLGAGEPEHSPVGIALAALSLAVMPVLSWAERRTGRELGSASAVADSHQTLLCSYLSAVLLLGLLANATLGWSWADPVAALVVAAVALKEAREAWRGDACCAPALPDGAGTGAAGAAAREDADAPTTPAGTLQRRRDVTVRRRAPEGTGCWTPGRGDEGCRERCQDACCCS